MCENNPIDAGAPEIDVTPEMVEAGAKSFYAHDPRQDDIEEILPDVFRAMVLASRLATE